MRWQGHLHGLNGQVFHTVASTRVLGQYGNAALASYSQRASSSRGESRAIVGGLIRGRPKLTLAELGQGRLALAFAPVSE